MVQELKLIRMNGLGNDFLIYDEFTSGKLGTLSKEQISALSSRNNKSSKGCDQFIILKSPKSDEDTFMEIYNADGSEVYACGNATRCVGFLLVDRLNKNKIIIRTKVDKLIAKKISNSEIEVNMGNPQFNWEQIPLSRKMDTLKLPLELEGFPAIQPSAVSMGNPHIVFFLEKSVETIDVPKLGAPLEVNSLFPRKTNVNFANILDKNNIRLRTFERGVGETLACGTGACATAVSAARLGLTENKVDIKMNGGTLTINWDAVGSNDVYMTGKVEMEGEINVNLE